MKLDLQAKETWLNPPYSRNELTAHNTDSGPFKTPKRIFHIRRGEFKVIKNKNISLDLKQFNEILKLVPDNKKAVAESLISEIIFMSKTLD